MRFFTPDLFIRFNSADDEEADRADEEWEAAIAAYRQHLESIRDQMPSHVGKLATLNLHDAELLDAEQPTEAATTPGLSKLFGGWSGLAEMSVRQGNDIFSLVYAVWDGIRRHQPQGPWPFSAQRKHWLYDEVDVASGRPGAFVHRILWSDGTVLEIPFVLILVHSFPLPESRPSVGRARTA